MKQASLYAAMALAGLAVFPNAAAAGEVPGTFPFSFSANGGTIDDNSINVFSQEMGVPGEPDPFIPQIVTLELQINGVEYQDWDDLDVVLINPFGMALEIMTDRGMGFSNPTGPGVNLTFSDLGTNLVPASGTVASGTYRAEGGSLNSTYGGLSGGTDSWILLVIDDAGNPGGGSFDQWVLRGTAVPEPATLSLLALGAVALLRRTRRRA